MQSVLKNILKENKLEELLVANWTQFLDSSKLMGYVLQNVRDRIDSFAVVPQTGIKQKGVQITLSRFQIVPTGFIVWVEFTVPMAMNQLAVGTTELHLTNTGNISHIQTIGSLFCGHAPS